MSVNAVLMNIKFVFEKHLRIFVRRCFCIYEHQLSFILITEAKVWSNSSFFLIFFSLEKEPFLQSMLLAYYNGSFSFSSQLRFPTFFHT